MPYYVKLNSAPVYRFIGICRDDSPEETLAWRERLQHILIEKMSSDAFERLTQRMLRESGFVPVEVTGRTGDGGIDGKGIARINGLMSFHKWDDPFQYQLQRSEREYY